MKVADARLFSAQVGAAPEVQHTRQCRSVSYGAAAGADDSAPTLKWERGETGCLPGTGMRRSATFSEAAGVLKRPLALFSVPFCV